MKSKFICAQKVKEMCHRSKMNTKATSEEFHNNISITGEREFWDKTFYILVTGWCRAGARKELRSNKNKVELI